MALSKRRDPFAALAHPIRRDILVLLGAEPGMSAGAIAGNFPRVSRAAVSRHLGILRRACMVRARTRGRESHYSLERGSLGDVREWCAQFEVVLEGSLERLKRKVEEAG